MGVEDGASRGCHAVTIGQNSVSHPRDRVTVLIHGTLHCLVCSADATYYHALKGMHPTKDQDCRSRRKVTNKRAHPALSDSGPLLSLSQRCRVPFGAGKYWESFFCNVYMVHVPGVQLWFVCYPGYCSRVTCPLFVDSVRRLWLRRLLRQPPLAQMTLVVSLPVTRSLVGE